MPENDQLVSSTDLKGRITHCNPAFIDISGFDKDELLGASHNVVRHPEMPPVAFQNLWDTLKSHRPWMGIVKNRSKNGDHYWVDAFVTPVYEGDSVVGYESVRVKPEAADVERASRLYDAVSRGRSLPRRNRLSLRQTLIFSLALLGSGVAVGDVLVGGVDPVTAAESWGAWSLGAGLLSWFLLAPLQRVVRHARDEVDNPVLEQMYTGAVGDMPTIELASRNGATNSSELLNILLVDDNPDVRDSLKQLLSAFGHRVSVLDAGRKVVDTVRDDPPDLILLDLGMPDMDGYRVARELAGLAQRDRFKVVAVTGYAADPENGDAAQTDFDGYLLKPLTLDMLQPFLRKADNRSGSTSSAPLKSN